MLREINGYTVADGKQVAKYQDLKDDGSTACGGWMYCGIFPEEGRNLARSRRPDGPGGHGSHAGLGLRLAVEPAHALQPRLRRPRGAGRGRSARR